MILDGECIPFADSDGMLFSAGYLVILLTFMPLALMDLKVSNLSRNSICDRAARVSHGKTNFSISKENTVWQVLGFLVLLITSVGFVFLFIAEGIDMDNLPLWGTSWDTLFGVTLFNFSIVIAVPAWLYEKEPDVDVPLVINGSSSFAAALYILIGSLGAMTLPNISENMLER